MKRTNLAAFLLLSAVSSVGTNYAAAASAGERKWIMYAQKGNGDVYFFDPSRVEKVDALRHVWSGVQYKTSVMGAASLLTLLEIDCSKRTEKTLQSTFFTDKNWERAAMKTNKNETPNRQIKDGSMSARLAEIVCD
ncbi:MAG: surface-adhesin E family protein [Roseobacter sp.]|uniref:surface-adhesin E family protein n=1 Tax=Tateyamaria sp. TaxID=1929288 RepID=UPI00328ABD52